MIVYKNSENFKILMQFYDFFLLNRELVAEKHIKLASFLTTKSYFGYTHEK